MRKIFSYLKMYGDKALIFKLLLLSIASSILLVVLPLIQKRIIDSILLAHVEPKSIAFFFILSILLIALGILEAYLLIIFQLKIQKTFSVKLLNSISRSPSFVINTRGSGAFLNSVFGDAEQVSNMLAASNYFVGISNLITTIIILVITANWSLYFPIVIIIAYIITIVLLKYLENRQIEYFAKGREEIFKLNPLALEFIENRKSIMNAGSFERYLYELDKSIDTRDEFFMKNMLASRLASSLIDSIKNITMIVIFIISMLLILKDNLAISNFITMVAYIPASFLPLYTLKELRDNANKVDMLHNRNIESLNAKQKFTLPQSTEVKLKNIKVNYEDKSVLTNFNLKLDKMYGIVGVSGEGKSTIIKLLLGDLVPMEGLVNYGGVNISDINLAMRYSLYKMYYQDNEIFDASIKDNITLKKQPLSENDFRLKKDEYYHRFSNIRDLAKSGDYTIKNDDLDLLCDIYDFRDLDMTTCENLIQESFESIIDETINIISDIKINKNYYIAEKYEKLVTDLDLSYLSDRLFGQRGSNISGGEKNKICLARLLLLETDLPYLIDEPFTSIDLLSEKKSLEVLKSYIDNKRGIIISHKIDVLNNLADEMIVIKDGEMESKGKHDYLIKNSDLYRQLYDEYIKKSRF